MSEEQPGARRLTASCVRGQSRADVVSREERRMDGERTPMAHRWNGRFAERDDGEGQNDPSKDFPLRETLEDFAGVKREFQITMREVAFGVLMTAREVGKDEGYEFSAFDASNAYLALGELRARMRRALSTRHLVVEEGRLYPAHDTLRGRITMNPESHEVLFVIDGTPVSLAEMVRIVSMYEGFQFSLRLVDRVDELP